MRTLLVLTVLLLAGCAGSPEPQPDEDPGDQTPTPTTTASSTSASSTTTAPPAQEDDCEATVRPSGNQFVAECTVGRNLSPGNNPGLEVSTRNGAIRVQDGDDRATIRLWARAATEQMARDQLAAMSVSVDPDGVAITVNSPDWQQRGADVTVALDGGLLDTADLQTSNGPIIIDDFGGDAWDLQTSNAPVEVDGGADSIDIATSNAPVTVHGGTSTLDILTSNAPVTLSGQFVDVTVVTSNGAIQVEAAATATGTWTLRTQNGGISVVVPEPADTGYDVTLQTSNGGATIDLKDTEAVGPQSGTMKHERTNGFASRDVQLTLTGTTTNGSASVRGAGTAFSAL